MNNLIAVTIGDINGVGLDIILKLWKKKDYRNFVIFSNFTLLKKKIENYNSHIKINIVNNNKNKLVFNKFKINVFNYDAKSNVINTYLSLKFAHKLCLEKKFVGILTLPLRKDLIIKNINKNFTGHTEFFQSLEKKYSSNMLLIYNKIKISTLTTHNPIAKISKILKQKDFIYNRIISLNDTLKNDFNIKEPKLIISGLNPHAGEQGEIGQEELYLKKTFKKILRKGVKLFGPYSADTLLIRKDIKSYDCVIFMYHDQALIPFKYISKYRGVNYTGNLDVIRVSPDHGTAYDLVGTKNYSDLSIKNCFKTILKINNIRSINAKSKKVS